jgi:recombination protein RecR
VDIAELVALGLKLDKFNEHDMDLEQLVSLFAKLPGLGPRSARRIVLHLIKYKDSTMLPLSNSIAEVAHSITECEICNNFDIMSPCAICRDETRDKSIICVIESALDLWACERGKIYKGQYHVLGGALSAAVGMRPADLNIDSLINRCNDQLKEIIIATNATMDGQTTAFYISDRIKAKMPIKITRLAYGMPVGGELDYLDEGTIEAALESRKTLS